MTIPIKSPRKLIEVALPLDIINAACGREKSIRHGHPSTLHLWWARRPLAAARAVLFAQLVNDPGYQQGNGFKYGTNKKDAAVERKRLFKILEDLCVWENTTNEEVLNRARAEIRRSWQEVCDLNKDHPQASELFNPDAPPAAHDPFAGGGAIPLEVQRLGLKAYASDLNPVAVLINKAMIEIPPKFSGRAPVGPLLDDERGGRIDLPTTWIGTAGIGEDVRRYGKWIRDEAYKRLAHLYPEAGVTAAMAADRPELQPFVGKKLTVIAWLWARTVKSPNPAFSHVDVPLASTFVLCTKEGKEVYIEPVTDQDRYEFVIKHGTPPTEAHNGTKLARGANFFCLLSKTPIEPHYIKSEAMAGRMGSRLMAVVAETRRGRVYLPPTPEMEVIAFEETASWSPHGQLVEDARAFTPTLYGIRNWSDLFSQRQLVALTTFAELIDHLRIKVAADALKANWEDDGCGLSDSGVGATAYAEAISTYLAFGVSRAADAWSSIVTWRNQVEASRSTFARQALPMTWDYTEVNPFSDSCGNWTGNSTDWVEESLLHLPLDCSPGIAVQAAAQSQSISAGKVVSCDPPYYDNVPYADLSDFFYVWLRRSLKSVYPDLFSTISAPKDEELVACTYRHNGREGARAFFLDGMTQAIKNIAQQSHPAFPVTIYYAFKQSDTDGAATSNAGWETFLEAVIKAGFVLVGTWPMRTERTGRTRGNDSNALASSIILVCRQRDSKAPTVSRRDFLRELNAVLPEALDEMTKGSGDERSPVAPVDLSQAILGPGMAVFSKFAAVLEADGAPMTVRTALQLINRFLAEDDFDKDTQFCLHWFEQYGWTEGPFGEADTLSRAKGTSVDGARQAGVLESKAGKVRLRLWSEYPTDWDPTTDSRNPVWETLHQLIRTLKQDGETRSGALLSLVKTQAESIRQLAYRLYTLCERKGWAEEARVYNELITSWTSIEAAASATPREKQLSVFE